MAETAVPSFRARLDRLSRIVEELERSDDLDLELALARFEEGRKLHQELLRELAAYERRLEALVADGEGAPQRVPFAAGKDEHGDAGARTSER